MAMVRGKPDQKVYTASVEWAVKHDRHGGAALKNYIVMTRWWMVAQMAVPQDAPGRGAKPTPLTLGKPVRNLLGSGSGFLLWGKPSRLRRGGGHRVPKPRSRG